MKRLFVIGLVYAITRISSEANKKRDNVSLDWGRQPPMKKKKTF